MTKEQVIAMAREAGFEADLTQELLWFLFSYKEGVLFWNAKINQRIEIGSVAGSKDGNGYVQIMINGKRYKAHRLIFIMHKNFAPSTIDHINGVRDDNRIENLRAATLEENAHNRRISKLSTSGIKNVYWHKSSRKWQVAVSANGKQIHAGYFNTKEEAESAAISARNKHHQGFARHA